MKNPAEEFLTLEEVADILHLDQRTIKKVACVLGGRRIGYCWRFRWSAVPAYFDNAKFENIPGKGNRPIF